MDISGPLPFAGVQSAFDEFFQRGTLRSYWKSTYVEELTDAILDIIVAKARNRPSPRTFVIAFFMGGAINRVRAEDTAYSERSADWMVSIDGNWEDASDDDKVISWVRGAWGEVHELGTGSLYLNFTGVADEAVDRGRRERVRQGKSPAPRRDQGDLRPGQLLPAQQQHPPGDVRRPLRRVRIVGRAPRSPRGGCE